MKFSLYNNKAQLIYNYNTTNFPVKLFYSMFNCCWINVCYFLYFSNHDVQLFKFFSNPHTPDCPLHPLFHALNNE